MSSAAERLESRLLSIDLLRGVAALGVVLFHAFHNGGDVHAARDGRFFVKLPIMFGFAGVFLFFVISGFCIHLRWARGTSRGNAPKNDFIAFWKRRLRRLYPAYAVALTLGIVFAIRAGRQFDGAFGWDIVSHIFLIHNLDDNTLFTLNPVFWTLAIEEQLYLLYFLLLWLRRRFGWPAIIIGAFALRLGWQGVSFILARRGIEVVTLASAQVTWIIWVLGAISVEAYYKIIKLPRWCYSLPFGVAVASATAALEFYDRYTNYVTKWHYGVLLFGQLGWGLASFILVNVFVRAEPWLDVRRHAAYLKPMLWLGISSYSLYLFHYFVLEQLDVWYVPGVLAGISAGMLGYLLVERPFLRRAS